MSPDGIKRANLIQKGSTMFRNIITNSTVRSLVMKLRANQPDRRSQHSTDDTYRASQNVGRVMLSDGLLGLVSWSLYPRSSGFLSLSELSIERNRPRHLFQSGVGTQSALSTLQFTYYHSRSARGNRWNCSLDDLDSSAGPVDRPDFVA